jgi:hypothetical protein
MTRQTAVGELRGRTPRRRRPAPRRLWPLLRVCFRYSYTRNAWVLRGVGRRWGPVYLDL